MRTLNYLSPSSLKLWQTNKEEFYLRYLSDNSPPRFPQTQPMSIGSAFDARVKSYLHAALFGQNNDPKYGFEALFEAQVEEHNRDWARQHGEYAFEQYRSCGALSDLMIELTQAQGEPRFEFEVRGAVHGYREAETKTLSQVTLLGKPDVYFINSSGCHVVLDWKVNGYCSKSPWSPMAGYLRLRSANKTNYGMHKKCQPMTVNGVMVNIATNLETVNEEWAQQLTVYAWLCGEPVGSQFVVAIDQLVCDATRGQLPGIRVAEHRLLITRAFQEKVFQQAVETWEIVQSGWIFRDLDEETSRKRCEILDGQAAALKGDGSVADQWFSAACRG